MPESCEGMSYLGPDGDSGAETCLHALKVQRNSAIAEDQASVLAPGRMGPDLVLLDLCSPEHCFEMAAVWMLGCATVICLSDRFFHRIISEEAPKEEIASQCSFSSTYVCPQANAGHMCRTSQLSKA